MDKIEKMNPEIKQRWLEALRSGRYKQGQRVLKKNDGSFCCLGVLCDITKEELNLEWKKNPYFAYRRIGSGNVYGELPNEVIEYAGVSADGKMPVPCPSLAVLNDRGASFEQIADVIEKHL